LWLVTPVAAGLTVCSKINKYSSPALLGCPLSIWDSPYRAIFNILQTGGADGTDQQRVGLGHNRLLPCNKKPSPFVGKGFYNDGLKIFVWLNPKLLLFQVCGSSVRLPFLFRHPF